MERRGNGCFDGFLKVVTVRREIYVVPPSFRGYDTAARRGLSKSLYGSSIACREWYGTLKCSQAENWGGGRPYLIGLFATGREKVPIMATGEVCGENVLWLTKNGFLTLMGILVRAPRKVGREVDFARGRFADFVIRSFYSYSLSLEKWKWAQRQCF